jgi:serine/threonine-protein kinase HipA
VERLCYIGKRATGALEFSPVINEKIDQSVPVEVGELVELAQLVVDERSSLDVTLAENVTDALMDIIRVGTSAGGARPKAVIALNDATGEVRTGQVDAPEGFDHWILKFDGVEDRELGDPAGYGRIEYAYYQLATAAGIKMTECRLFEEGGRAHFMTRRFDRPSGNEKLHQHSLSGMAHFDFNEPGGYAYEQAFQVMRRLRLPYEDTEEQYRRMVFNVAARNQDDHPKNIAYLMDRDGEWRLSPAFDVIYAYNPAGKFTSKHQMSIGGKRDGITRADLLQVGTEMSVKQCPAIIDDVVGAVSNWPDYAKDAGVDPAKVRSIGNAHQLL